MKYKEKLCGRLANYARWRNEEKYERITVGKTMLVGAQAGT